MLFHAFVHLDQCRFHVLTFLEVPADESAQIVLRYLLALGLRQLREKVLKLLLEIRTLSRFILPAEARPDLSYPFRLQLILEPESVLHDYKIFVFLLLRIISAET